MFLQNRFRDQEFLSHPLLPPSLPPSLVLHCTSLSLLSVWAPPLQHCPVPLVTAQVDTALKPDSFVHLLLHYRLAMWKSTALTAAPCTSYTHTHTWCTVHTQILLFFKGKRHYILCKRHKCFTEEDASRLPPTTSTLVMLKSTEAQTRQPAVYLLRSRLYLCRFKEAKS